MTDTPSLEYSKAKLQAVLTEAGIDFAKSWNKGQLVDAWNVAHPVTNGDDGQIHMSFGPNSTEFMINNGYEAERVSDAGRGWFTINPADVEVLLKSFDSAIDKTDSKATARNFQRAQGRISDRLTKLTS